MKISTPAKQRILFLVCFLLLLLACNLAPVGEPAPTPAVSAITLPTDTPSSSTILSPDVPATVEVPPAETVSNQCAAAPAGLIGWWPGNGDAWDVVAGREGRLNGGAGFAGGKVGQAFSFDGVDDSVDVPRAGVPEVRRQVTIEFWMKPDADNEMNRCCQGLVGTEYDLVEIARGWSQVFGVNFVINNGNTYKQTSDENNAAFPVPAGEWSFIASTYDGQSLRLYVNGQEVQSLNHRGKMAPMFPDSFLIIGSEDGRAHCDNCDGRHFFKGLIDEVSVYERALSAEEIWSVFAANEAGKCTPSP